MAVSTSDTLFVPPSPDPTSCSKPCTQCREMKPLDDFYTATNTLSGRQSWCKECIKARARESENWKRLDPVKVARRRYRARCARYGLSIEEFEAMLETQGFSCALCQKPGDGATLQIDHDHASGRVRGLLCTTCNAGLGKLGDSVRALERARDYLLAAGVGTSATDPA